MKKFVIEGIAVGNVAKLPSIHIEPKGGNIIVTGQNGAGKTTFAKALLWLIMGGTTDGEKLIPLDGNYLPYVEVELTDGTLHSVLRKEMIQKTDSRGKISRTTDCFMGGLPVTQKAFQEFFGTYVPQEIFQVLMSLGSFFKLKPDVQRKILTDNFVAPNVDEELLKSAEFEKLWTPPDLMKIKALKKKLEGESAKIPAMIEALTSQIVEVTDDRSMLETELAALKKEFNEVTKSLAMSREKIKQFELPREELRKKNYEFSTLNNEYKAGKAKLESDKARLEKLRKDWVNAAEVCPTCEQRITGAHADKVREKIKAEGDELSKQIKDTETKLAEMRAQGRALKKEIEKLTAEVESQNYDTSEVDGVTKRLNELQDEMSARRDRVRDITSQLNRNAANQKRIDELMAREKDLGRQLTECEFQIDLIGKFISRKMELVTESINSQFKVLQFRMFEKLKSGEVQNICEATLNGVPYTQLSKGEKFKVALDLLNTFQNHFGVMFPLIIDDAESYTSNSLIEIPNQKIILKAVEGQVELHIDYAQAEGRKVA